MTYTVGEVSRLARVSVRALHHWDEIGLVKPSRRSPAGYRLYTDTDLDRLQQVLFLRELGLKLEDIAATLRDPAFDIRSALLSHRAVLLQRLGQTRALLDLVDRTLHAMDGGTHMSPEEKFEVFGQHDPVAFEAEAQARWGQTPEYAEAARRTKRYTAEQWKAQRAEWSDIVSRLAALVRSGVPPTDPRAGVIAEEHRAHIDRWFYPCSAGLHRHLSELYVSDPRFAATYDAVHPGLAVYLRDAVAA